MAELDFALLGVLLICIFSLGISVMAYTKPDIKLRHDKKGNINPNAASIYHYLESEDGIDFMNKFMHNEKFLQDLDFVKKHDLVIIKNGNSELSTQVN